MASSGETHVQAATRVPWDRLRAWIDDQEAREKNDAPGSVTESQVKAISQLIPIVDEPRVSDRDYVSALMQHLQGEQLGLAKFTDLPMNAPINGTLQLRWLCLCNLTCCEGEFPRQGYGVRPAQEAPMFQSKKSAKQYAAKYALKFLQDKANGRERRGSVTEPTIKSEGITSEGITSEGITSGGIASARPAEPSDEQSPNKRPRHSDDGDQSIYDQISVLAGQLGFGSLGYKIEPNPDKTDFYSGRPLFMTPGRAPPDLGVVSDVYGKKQTKMQIAGKVLEWLQREEQVRRSLLENALQ